MKGDEKQVDERRRLTVEVALTQFEELLIFTGGRKLRDTLSSGKRERGGVSAGGGGVAYVSISVAEWCGGKHTHQAA